MSYYGLEVNVERVAMRHCFSETVFRRKERERERERETIECQRHKR